MSEVPLPRVVGGVAGARLALSLSPSLSLALSLSLSLSLGTPVYRFPSVAGPEWRTDAIPNLACYPPGMV